MDITTALVIHLFVTEQYILRITIEKENTYINSICLLKSVKKMEPFW